MKQIFVLIFLLMATLAATAQHEHHQPAPQKPKAPAPVKKAAPVKKTIKRSATVKPAQPQQKNAPAAKPAPQPVHQHTVPASDATEAVDHSMHEDETGETAAHDMDDMEGEDTAMHEEHAATHEGHDMSNMSHAFSINLPMNRNGSGTGWLPDTAPMYGKMYHGKKWMFMLHGNVFVRYNKQDLFDKGTRGDAKFDIPNWFMAMGQRRVGQRGLFHFNTMLSPDAPIAGGEGYPLLFQSGETWQGKPLIDRQHPHDLFSELSVSYAHAFSKKVDAFVYVGYPGEPALGSVAFMHRPSALPNPDAPISHHWNDATHITFGVATLGVRVGKFKLEGPSFTGREPDENRYDFDKPRFDSWSGRLSFAPSANWTMHVGHGFVKEPEATHPGEDVNRTTASVMYSKDWRGRLLNVTALWGINKEQHHDGENAALLEASYAVKRLNVYGRYEWIQKSAEELGLDEKGFVHTAVFPVNALTPGVGYDVLRFGAIRVAAGTQASLYMAHPDLDPVYGNNPMAGQVYLRLYPARMN